MMNSCLPGGMWCIAMLAGAATLPCGKVASACSHSVWESILVSFMHPLLHQVRPLFCKSITCSADQPPTWTAHQGYQTGYKRFQHSAWHCAPDGLVLPVLHSARTLRKQFLPAGSFLCAGRCCVHTGRLNKAGRVVLHLSAVKIWVAPCSIACCGHCNIWHTHHGWNLLEPCLRNPAKPGPSPSTNLCLACACD